MFTDIHTHIYDEKTLKEYFRKAPFKDGKIISMHWHTEKLEELISFSETHENVFIAASVNMEKPARPQLAKFEKLFKEKKIVGLKMYPGYQYFYPSDKAVDPFAKLCAKYGKPLIFHSGDFYDPEAKKPPLLKYSRPFHVDELAGRNPGTKIILAHFGFPYMLVAANMVSKNPNVYTDISGTIDGGQGDRIAREYIKDLRRVLNYYYDIEDKIMFGTDFSGEHTDLCRVRPYFKVVEEVFSAKKRKRILSGLAEKLFFS
jgi:uncharacterized protein